MSQTVLILQPVSAVADRYLAAQGYIVKRSERADEAAVLGLLPGVDGLLVRNAPVTPAMLDAAPSLKVIGRHGVGVENIDLDDAARRGIWVTNAPLSNYNAVAEHAMMLVLCCAKNFTQVDKHFRAGDFDIRDRVRNVELRDKVLGVVGLGRIGRRVAQMAAGGFSMRVVGYDPFVPQEQDVAHVERTPSLEQLLEQADLVTLHLPLTDRTKNMIDARRLAQMKPTAYLINTARGGIVDEAALIAALKNGVIAGAGLDVTQAEPPDFGSPLFGMENVVLTPHDAAHTAEAFENMALHAAQGIDEVLRGDRPTWPVNDPTTSKQERE